LFELPPSAHPKISTLYAYWQRIAPGPCRLPGRQNLNPADIPTLLPNIWMLDVLEEPRRFRHRLIGTEINRRGFTVKDGEIIEPTPVRPGDPRPLQDLERVVAERTPVWFRGKPVASRDRFVHELERLHLPLAGNGTDVDVVLSLSVFYERDGRAS
jgi:hypothetical protein